MALSDEEIDSVGFTFVWRIENFSYCIEQRNCCIQSPNFAPNLHDYGYVWNMQIYPRGEGNSNDITYQLHNISQSLSYKFMDFQLCILASDGSLTNSIERENVNFVTCKGETFIDYEELFSEKKDFYLPQDTLTLHLRMWGVGRVRSWMGQSFARTLIGVQKRSINWKIQNFSNMKSFENKIFLVKYNLKENVLLRFYLRLSFECKEILEMEISETDVSQDNLICGKIAILDYKGSCVYLTAGDHWFEKGEGKNGWTFPISILKSTLMANKYLYLPNDTLTLQCDFALSSGIVHSELEIAEVGPKTVPCVNSFIPEVHQLRRKIENVSKLTDSLSSDLFNQYTEGADCDFELRSGSSNFPVHKTVLMARSPVFRRMLSNDMIEKNSNVVDIPDLDSDTVKRILHFMYTDAIEVVEWDAISKLYFAADKYGIESLKKKCSSFLEWNICASNVCEALELGDLHQGQDLKVAAMTFVPRNDDKILSSEKWIQFRNCNSSLAADVLQWMYLKKNEKK